MNSEGSFVHEMWIEFINQWKEKMTEALPHLEEIQAYCDFFFLEMTDI